MSDRDTWPAFSGLRDLERVVRPALRRACTTDALFEDDQWQAINGAWAEIARHLPPAHKPPKAYWITKRAFDLVAAAVLLVMLSPIFVVLALAIKVDDGGAVLFGHDRVCRCGKSFKCWKFRTMRESTGSEIRMNPALWVAYVDNDFKISFQGDARLTRLGRRLRDFRIDELPQLWNVIRGELSLVGPRPLVPVELTWYGPYAMELLGVRPGLTGRWQASWGPRYPQRAWLELVGVRQMSWSRDFLILARTVKRVVARKGIAQHRPEEANKLLDSPLRDGSLDG